MNEAKQLLHLKLKEWFCVCPLCRLCVLGNFCWMVGGVPVSYSFNPGFFTERIETKLRNNKRKKVIIKEEKQKKKDEKKRKRKKKRI